MRLRTATVLLAALGLLTTGCSDDKKPQTLPSLTPTPTVTTAPVVIPSAATPATAMGADAFVHFYFEQLNAAFRSSDASLVRPLSDPACATCNNFMASFDSTPNEVIQGDTFRILSVAAPPISAETLVEVLFDTPARKLVDRATGRVLKELPAKARQHFQVNVVRAGTVWRVRGIRFAAT